MPYSLTWLAMEAWMTRGWMVLEAMREGSAERSAVRGALRVSNHETEAHKQVSRPAGANLVDGNGARHPLNAMIGQVVRRLLRCEGSGERTASPSAEPDSSRILARDRASIVR